MKCFVQNTTFLISYFKIRQWRGPGVFIVNFEQISNIALVFPLMSLNK